MNSFRRKKVKKYKKIILQKKSAENFPNGIDKCPFRMKNLGNLFKQRYDDGTQFVRIYSFASHLSNMVGNVM